MMKRPFGPWVRQGFRLLARLKGLRGTPWDIFGRTEERRGERALIKRYRDSIHELLKELNAATLNEAAEIARLPEEIRGYGHVKARHLDLALAKWDRLMAAWRVATQAR